MAIIITKPLVLHQSEYTAEINQLAMDKILPRYPYYLQFNTGREPSTPEAITMFTWIDSIRAFANLAKALVATDTDLVAIRAVMDQYVINLNTIN